MICTGKNQAIDTSRNLSSSSQQPNSGAAKPSAASRCRIQLPARRSCGQRCVKWVNTSSGFYHKPAVVTMARPSMASICRNPTQFGRAIAGEELRRNSSFVLSMNTQAREYSGHNHAQERNP